MNRKKWVKIRKKGLMLYIIIDGFIIGLSTGFFFVVFRYIALAYKNEREMLLLDLINDLLRLGLPISLLGFPIAYFSWKAYERKYGPFE